MGFILLTLHHLDQRVQHDRLVVSNAGQSGPEGHHGRRNRDLVGRAHAIGVLVGAA